MKCGLYPREQYPNCGDRVEQNGFGLNAGVTPQGCEVTAQWESIRAEMSQCPDAWAVVSSPDDCWLLPSVSFTLNAQHPGEEGDTQPVSSRGWSKGSVCRIKRNECVRHADQTSWEDVLEKERASHGLGLLDMQDDVHGGPGEELRPASPWGIE